MTEHTIEGAKLAEYLLDTIRSDRYTGVARATIAVGEVLEVTVQVPHINGASCDALQDILGITDLRDVVAVRMEQDHAEVVRQIMEDGELVGGVVDRIDYT